MYVFEKLCGYNRVKLISLLYRMSEVIQNYIEI